MADRPDGFYWVIVCRRSGWEPARWHKGLWLTLGGPTDLREILQVVPAIPAHQGGTNG